MSDRERLPPISQDQMTPEQVKAAQAITAGPRGALRGPFAVLIRSPVLMDRVQKLGEHIRFGGVLADDHREFAILVTGARWKQRYEWSVHAGLAAKAGVRQDVIEALGEDRRPDGLSEDEQVIYGFCRNLNVTGTVGDDLFEGAKARFGEAGVVELSALCGYYTMLAMMLNVAGTPPLDGIKTPF